MDNAPGEEKIPSILDKWFILTMNGYGYVLLYYFMKTIENSVYSYHSYTQFIFLIWILM